MHKHEHELNWNGKCAYQTISIDDQLSSMCTNEIQYVCTLAHVHDAFSPVLQSFSFWACVQCFVNYYSRIQTPCQLKFDWDESTRAILIFNIIISLAPNWSYNALCNWAIKSISRNHVVKCRLHLLWRCKYVQYCNVI